jgi:small-conductance mechanosensitive channel
MLAVTQPLRVGDWVTVEGNYGEVEDVRLNYTILRTLGGPRIVIPNERLAGGILKNDTLVDDASGPDVSIWLAPDADVERALAVLTEETGAEPTVAEILPWGVRLSVGGAPVAPADRGAHEADLRRRCFVRLRSEGLLRAP